MKNPLFSRSLRLARVLIAFAFLMTGCGGGSSQSTPAGSTDAPSSGGSGSLTVLDWSEYGDAQLRKPFTAEHPNVKVDFSFFAENPEALTKVQSGFKADLVHPCSDYYGLFVDADVMQPIDTSRLKNWSGVTQQLAQQGQINGKQYFIPWDWGYESIVVRTDNVPNPPQSWADLWKPEYAGHLALQDAGEANFVMTAHMLGFDPWNTTDEQNAQVKAKLNELKANALTYWSDSTALEQQIASGDVWIAANVWPDTYLNLKKQGVPVAYITPKEGRLGWLCGYGITKNSKNIDLDYDYLDALLAPESMAYMSNQFAYGAANANALKLTDPTLVNSLQLNQPDIFDNTVFYKAVTSQRNDLFNTTWSEVKAGS